MRELDELQRILEEGDVEALTLTTEPGDYERAHDLFIEYVDELERLYNDEDDRCKRRALGSLRTDAILMMGDLSNIYRPIYVHKREGQAVA
jgi:hypothetical protein